MKRWRNNIAFWVDKAGNKLTRKQFFKRWGEGLQSVTPLQQTIWQMWSTWIILLGILCGIVITSFNFKSAWWLTIILVGALFNTCIQMLGLWQKKTLLNRFDLSLSNDTPNDNQNKDKGGIEK